MKQSLKLIAFISLTLGLIGLTGCAGTPEIKTPDAEPVNPAIVRLSPEAERVSGITLITVGTRPGQRELTTQGEIRADENRVFHISAMASGRMIQDYVNLGEQVRQGQTLAVIQNPELIRVQAASIHELHANELAIKQAQAKLMLALENSKRERKLFDSGISPRKDWQQASTEARIARTELQSLQEHNTHIRSEAKAMLGAYGVGFNPNSETLRSGSPLTAPKAGIVTRKNVTVGDTVSPEQTLYEIADLSQVWLDLTIYANEVAKLRPGSPVSFQSDSLPGRVFNGTVNYIQSEAMPKSQTFLVRAFLNNASGLLKPGMFGQATIQQTEGQSMPFVPESAIQTYGKETFVFVPVGQGQYRKQTVRKGTAADGGYLIEQGLEAGTKVVGKGGFTLKAEMLKREFAEEE